MSSDPLPLIGNGGFRVPYLELYDDEQAAADFTRGFKKGEIDACHIYINGLGRWAKVLAAAGYQPSQDAANALLGFFKLSYWRQRRNSIGAVIDLGPGTGDKALQFVKELHAARERLSLVLVDIAAHHLRDAVNRLGTSGQLWLARLDAIAVRDNFLRVGAMVRHSAVVPYLAPEGSSNLFLLLGNTLGNLPESLMLRQLHDASRPGDIVVIGQDLLKTGEIADWQEIIKPYDSDPDVQNLFRASIERFVSEGICDGVIKARWVNDPAWSAVPGTASIEVWTIVDGKPAKIGHSNRYHEGSLITFIERHGFTHVESASEGGFHKLLAFVRTG